MSLTSNIYRFSQTPGIEAAVVCKPSSRAEVGSAVWHPLLAASIDLLALTEETSIRLVVGKHTIVVQRESDETVAVVLPTGHAIAKSLRRMIRRMARKNRGDQA